MYKPQFSSTSINAASEIGQEKTNMIFEDVTERNYSYIIDFCSILRKDLTGSKLTATNIRWYGRKAKLSRFSSRF